MLCKQLQNRQKIPQAQAGFSPSLVQAVAGYRHHIASPKNPTLITRGWTLALALALALFTALTHHSYRKGSREVSPSAHILSTGKLLEAQRLRNSQLRSHSSSENEKGEQGRRVSGPEARGASGALSLAWGKSDTSDMGAAAQPHPDPGESGVQAAPTDVPEESKHVYVGGCGSHPCGAALWLDNTGAGTWVSSLKTGCCLELQMPSHCEQCK